MAYNLACWCIQMVYTQHSWMLMDIVVGLSVRPSVRLFVYGIFRWLCICWQITWNKWHKIWHDNVVIIGRWLLPSLVDTGDICCHYWQLILVHCSLVMPYGSFINRGQHLFWKWLVALCHQAITWTNIDLSSARPCAIHLKAFSNEIILISIHYISLKASNVIS